MNARFVVVILVAGCGYVATRPSGPLPLPDATPPQRTVTISPEEIAMLLKPCPIAEPQALTREELIRVANARKDALVTCNADKAKARQKLLGN